MSTGGVNVANALQIDHFAVDVLNVWNTVTALFKEVYKRSAGLDPDLKVILLHSGDLVHCADVADIAEARKRYGAGMGNAKCFHGLQHGAHKVVTCSGDKGGLGIP